MKIFSTIFTTLITFTLFFNTPTYASSNMLVNGEFTYWDWGWEQWMVDWDSDADILFGGQYLDARVTIREGGAVPWAIQFYQGNLNIEKGRSYEVSFDATTYGKTVEAGFDVLVEENGGDYTHYMTPQTVNVNPGAGKFSYQFTMLEATDPYARLTFNFGLNDGLGDQFATVIGIDNVVVREIPGNLIKNGEFNENLDFWDHYIDPIANANIYHSDYDDVRATIEYGGETWWHVQLTQAGLPLEQGKTYALSFDISKASKSGDSWADVVIEENGGNYKHYIAPERVYAGVITNRYTREFTMLYESDFNARLTFNMGENAGPWPGPASTIFIDNVELVEVNNN